MNEKKSLNCVMCAEAKLNTKKCYGPKMLDDEAPATVNTNVTDSGGITLETVAIIGQLDKAIRNALQYDYQRA